MVALKTGRNQNWSHSKMVAIKTGRIEKWSQSKLVALKTGRIQNWHPQFQRGCVQLSRFDRQPQWNVLSQLDNNFAYMPIQRLDIPG
jgi:hypothetical protein